MNQGRVMEWAVLSQLTDEQRRALLATMVRRRYASGDTLFFEGDAGDTFHLLAKGRVAVRIATPMGDTATLAVLGPGDSFGEQALVSEQARRTASVVALTPVETLLLNRSEFNDLRSRVPGVSKVLVELLAEQVRRLSTLVLDAHYVPAESRVARRLADLVPAFGGDPTQHHAVEMTLTQEDLASMSGTTRPTTNRALQQLADANIISLSRGKVRVLDPVALRKKAFGLR